jgi:hypothetical protein
MLAVCVIAGCSGDKPSDHGSASSAPPPKPVPMLDGAYRVDIEGYGEVINGQPKPDDSTLELYFALRSACDGNRCVAAGFRVHDEHNDRVDETDPAVFDLVDGAWTLNQSDYFIECGGVIVPGLSTLAFASRDDGTLTGHRRMACFAPSGPVVRENPVTLTRVGDVLPTLPMPDPLQQPPLMPSAGAGLNGPYRVTYTPTGGGERASFEANLTTTCTRNTEGCLTLVRSQGFNGLAPVSAWRLENGRWLSDWTTQDDCGEGVTAEGAYHEEWVMPEKPAGPIQRVSGSQIVTHQTPCASAPAERAVVLERIID